MTKSFDQITKEATSDEGLSAKNAVYFHYFNPNGLYKVSQDVADAVWDLYLNGKITAGATVVHNMSYSSKEIIRMSRLARVSPRDVAVWKRMIEADIARGRKFLAEIEAGVPVSGAKVSA